VRFLHLLRTSPPQRQAKLAATPGERTGLKYGECAAALAIEILNYGVRQFTT